MPASSRIRIGISANILPADPTRALFKGKALHFSEEKMGLALYRAGATPLILPDLKDEPGAAAVLDEVDGLLLSGGADVSPRSYGEDPLDERWLGDWSRDQYEIRLTRGALDRNLPILGICRGIQLLNVAFGGTLLQDIGTQRPQALVHRDWERYEIIEHPVRLAPDGWVARVYGGASEILVNTVHHQAIKDLAPELRPTAWAPDGIVEAAESVDEKRWMMGVQWHPEWLDGTPEGGSHRTSGAPVFAAFIDACRRRRESGATL